MAFVAYATATATATVWGIHISFNKLTNHVFSH